MDTYSHPTSQKSKLTLTNWVRLNNAPLLLPKASGVQWNDYVFVLARDGRALLYRNKHNMWSMLPKSPYTSTNLAPALTLHNGRILTMSSNGEVSMFDSQSCQWTVDKDLNMSEGSGPRILVSDNNNLYSVVDFKSQVQQGGPPLGGHWGQPAPPSKDCTVFSYDPSSKWEKIGEIGSSPLKSAAVAGGTLFVHAGEEMFKLTLPVKQKVAAITKLHVLRSPLPPTTTALKSSAPVYLPTQNILRNQPPLHQPSLLQPPQRLLQTATACASPTYAGSTLHAIKDTLFSFGGRDKDNQPTSDVLRYNPDTDTWESAGYMRSCRYNVAVATVQDTTLDVVVLGGSLGSSEYTMTQRQVQSDPVVHVVGFSPTSSPRPPTWDNKTSIIEKCTVN